MLLDPALTGILFTNHVDERLVVNNQILENGAGVALGDIDGDGLCDIYLCGSGLPNQLYRNLGNLNFTNVTEWAGLNFPAQFSTGAVLVDIDGDGDLDLLVNGLGTGTRAFLNDGRGRFEESRNSGLSRVGAATSMALADMDGDGDLDLYVAHYRVSSARNDPLPPHISARVENGKVKIEPADQFFGILRSDGTIEVVEKGEPDRLYRNDGHGRFTAVSWTDGAFLDERGKALTAAPEDWGLSVMMRDLTGDGWVDLYVCNDFFRSRDQLWIGDGHGHFRAADPLRWRSMPLASMAIDAGDLDRDGIDDFLVVDMLSRDPAMRQRQRANLVKLDRGLPLRDPRYQPEILQNTLQLGQGEGGFSQVAQYAGLAATDWSWSVVFLDVDLDGWEDILVGTGNGHDVLDMDAQNALDHPSAGDARRGIQFYPPLPQNKLAFRNRHDLTFEETGAAWGFSASGITHGMALADLDNDGDLDVVCNNFNAAASVHRNNSIASRLAVRLAGNAPNTRGIGARIRVFGGAVPMQQQQIMAGGRYLSSDAPQRTFAAGNATVLSVEVSWPSGRIDRLEGVEPNQIVEVREGTSPAPAPVPTPAARPLFENVSAVLKHLHQDSPFDDVSRQPLLPSTLSTPGPGVAWGDLDGDGFEDLVIAGGKGGSMGVYRGDGHGAFSPVIHSIGRRPAGQESMAVAVAGAGLWFSQSAYADPGSAGSGAQISRPLLDGPLRLRAGESIPIPSGAWGPLALADVDGDGRLDLFLGGRAVPGRFPESIDSALLFSRGETWERASVSSEALRHLGMVSAAVFTDLDGDGAMDLALACDWGGVRLFHNQTGVLVPWDPPVVTPPGAATAFPLSTLARLTGRWHGIVAGDFDGDGRMDLALTNQGDNTSSRGLLPWHLFFGDFSGGGGVDILEAFATGDSLRLLPSRGRDGVGAAIPRIAELFPTFQAYSMASVEEMLGAEFATAGHLRLETFSSVVLLNRGDRFELRPLPREAQFAPAFGIVVADFDGDGMEDLFLAQNFFGDRPEVTRSDAGRGLLLRGDGQGNFQALAGSASGIAIHGEQRGAATGDFDKDGRPDLVVGQHAGATQLLHNVGGRPGLRVRLRGPAANPEGIGASVRLRFEDHWGPRREIHAGSGYLSSDSPVCVMATPATAKSVEVRWPGGRVQSMALEINVREVTLSSPE